MKIEKRLAGTFLAAAMLAAALSGCSGGRYGSGIRWGRYGRRGRQRPDAGQVGLALRTGDL